MPQTELSLKPLLSIKEANRKETKGIARKYAASSYATDIVNNNIIIGGKNTRQEKRFNRLFNRYYSNNLEHTYDILENKELLKQAKAGNVGAYQKYITKGTDKVAKKLYTGATFLAPMFGGVSTIASIAPDIADVGLNLMSGNYLGAGVSAATSFLPQGISNIITKNIKSKQLSKFINDNLDNISISEKLKPNEITYLPRRNNTPAIPLSTAKRIVDKQLKTPDVIELPQLSNTSTKRLLKDFNLKFAKRYGYDTLPLNLDFEQAKQAIQELGNRHNTFIRGVSDPMNNPRLTGGEILWIKKSMAEKGLDWNNYDDRIKHAVEIHTPSFTNFGRGDTNRYYLATVDKHTGDLLYEGSRFDDDSVFIGTSYASNSAAFGKGYDYNKGEVALVRRPFQLGDNPYDWKTDIDFVLNREGGKHAAKNNYDDLLYEYVTGRNLNADVAKEVNVGKQINDYRYKTNKLLNSPIYDYDKLLNHITNRQLQNIKINSRNFTRYRQPNFDNDILDNIPYKQINNYQNSIDKLMEKYKYNYRTKYPRNIKDYIYLSSLYDNLFVHKEYFKNKRHAINNAFAKSKKLLKDIETAKPKINYGYNVVNPSSSQTYRELVLERGITDKNGRYLPRANEFFDKIIKENEIFTNERGRYYSKSKTPYTRHYISKGKVGTKAWDLIRYITPEEINGIITRQHIDAGYTPITTRKTKKLGGNEKS